MPGRVLVVNAGSSSVKLSVLDEEDNLVVSETVPAAGGQVDEGVLASVVQKAKPIDAVGHRVVHGGTEFIAPVLIDDNVVRRLEALTDLAPLHQPKSLQGLKWVSQMLPDVPAVACFDTAFHATIPAAAHTYALPGPWRRRWDLRRYGFHGLSHAYASRRVAELMAAQASPGQAGASGPAQPGAGGPAQTGAGGPAQAGDVRPVQAGDVRPVQAGDVRPVQAGDGGPAGALRVVTCHLGAGASLAAVQGGLSVDTTMGFTPLEGLVMATRSGSVDPGLLLWLEQHIGIPSAELASTLENRSGLLGLAGTADMRQVLQAEAAGDDNAALAMGVYLHRLRAAIAAMVAALGGLDALVYTGGVGEKSAPVRWRTAEGLEFLGVALDREANNVAQGDQEVSRPGAAVRTFVVEAREDKEIVRGVRQVLGRSPAPA